MEKKFKIILGIAGALVAAAGIYIAVAKPFKKKEEEEAKDEKKPEEEKKAQDSSGGGAPKKPQHSLTVNKAPAKGDGFGAKPAPTPAPAKAGKKIWVYAAMDGVNVYNKSTKKGVAIGSKYNNYNKGGIIGTFAGTASVSGEKWFYVNDGSTKLIVSSKLVYTKTF